MTDALAQRAVMSAVMLAKQIGHAAAVLKRGRAQYDVADSWKPVDRKWKVWALVSADGTVARQDIGDGKQ